MLLIGLTIIGAVIASGVAFVTLVRNPSSSVHRWLFFLVLAACVWVVSVNLHGVVPHDAGLWLLRCAFAAAALLSLAMVQFVYTLCGLYRDTRSQIIFFVTACSTALLSLSSWVVADFSGYTTGGALVPVRGWAYPLVLVLILTMLIYSLLVLHHYRRQQKGVRRTQLSIVEFGLAAGAIVGIVTNIVLPNLTGTTYPSRFAFLAIIILTVSLLYAVVQHRFLDIRFTVARTAAYLITLIIMAGLYFGILFGMVQLTLIGFQADLVTRQLIEVVAALLLAVSFGPLKVFFDKVTRQLFFRDAYETKEVLDSISEVMVEEVDVSSLVQRTGIILLEATKGGYLEIVLTSPLKNKVIRELTVGERPHENQRKLLQQLARTPQKLVTVDELQQPTNVQHALTEANVAVAVRLETSKEVMGYMLVGYKATGAAFTNQDIGLLRIVAEELAVAIQNAMRFEEIIHFNETLRKEIKDATAQLRESNRKLQKLDEVKDEFISMASHQLRTPLTSVKGYLSMVLDGDAGKLQADQRKLLQEAYSSAQRMVYLIGDFLNISRLQTGKFIIERKPLDLGHMVEDEIKQLANTAARRDITLVYKPVRVPHISADANKLRQVMMNFIDNAIFYSKPGSEVRIELASHDQNVCFRVIDTGMGVPKDEQAKLFTKFFRAKNARNARPDGTGIGLFMAKKVITAHGGEVVFKTQENKGSTFGFCLPRHLEDEA